jgi:hypothetical protein
MPVVEIAKTSWGRAPTFAIGLACGFTEKTPYLDGIEVIAESSCHPVLPRATRAHRVARLHVEK